MTDLHIRSLTDRDLPACAQILCAVVLPACQGQGAGRTLMSRLEEYVARRGLAGLTLSTNRYAPAPEFYQHLGFSDCGHVLFMSKEVSP